MKKKKSPTKRNNLLVRFSIFCIKKFWQENMGPKYKNKHNIICRFYPDCSNYGIKALEKHGFFLGWLLSIKRIRRCNLMNTKSCIDFP